MKQKLLQAIIALSLCVFAHSALAQTMTLNSPNAGATWQVGTSQTVSWSVSGNTTQISYFVVRLSINNGSSYIDISANLSAATRSFNYTPTSGQATTTAVCWVRAFNSSGTVLAGAISSGAFTIASPPPTMTLNSPNAGATWQIGTSQTVNWSVSGDTTQISYFVVRLSINNGSSYTDISANLSAATRSFNYTPTSGQATTTAVCWVRAFNSSGTFLAGAISSGPFTIANPAPTMTLNSPNAGATWQIGTSQTVNWSVSGDTTQISYFVVRLSTDNASSYTDISANLSAATRSFNYTPTSGQATTTAVVWVRAFNSSGTFLAGAISSGPFTIIAASGPALTVTAPNGGETWALGVAHTITWSVTGDTSQINNFLVSYSLDGGSTYLNDVGTATAASLSISWTPPLVISPTAVGRIRLQARNASNSVLSQDVSDGTFTFNNNASTILAGFDTHTYPTDSVMAWLHQNSNLSWVGYYLYPAPSRNVAGNGGSSWMGHRSTLLTQGWTVAPIYIGEQDPAHANQDPGNSSNPSTLKGTQDGNSSEVNSIGLPNSAVPLLIQEGFPIGSIVYLDIETSGAQSQPELDYIIAWCAAVRNAGYVPGIYCLLSTYSSIAAVEPSVPFWIANPTNPSPGGTPYPTMDPSGSGVANAIAWQYQSAPGYTIAIPGSSLQVDLDVVKSSQSVPTDTTPPTITAFSVTPSSITVGNSFTASYTVSDSGGSGLTQVVLRRSSGDGTANDPGWLDIQTITVAGNGPLSGSFNPDTPPSVGTYWYGMAVFDGAGNHLDERAAGLGPLQRSVTTLTYTINASAGSGGSISPSGSFSKNAGDNQAFTGTPNANYVVNQWLVDSGVVQNGGTGYTLNNIQATHSVQVTFTYVPPQYTISASAGTGGGISPNGSFLKNAGDNQSFTATPSISYIVNQWLVDSGVVQTGGTSYSLNNIQSPHNVQVTFTQASSPRINNPHRTGTTFTLSVPTQVGFNYTLEYKNAFSAANWTVVQTLSGTGGTITLTDTGATGSSRLYRVRVQ